MEIKRLRLFRSLIESGSLRKTAELAGLSPGAVSKALTELQRDLDLHLLTQEGRRLVPTPEGLRVYEKSREVIEQYGALRKKAPTPVREFRLASFEVFTSHFFPRVAEQMPEVRLRCMELGPGHLEAAVLEHRADAGLTYMPVPSDSLEFTRIGKMRLGVFGAPAFKSRNLSEASFAVPTTGVTGVPSGMVTLDDWPRRVRRKEWFHVELLETALALARAELALIYCPEFVVELQNENLQPSARLVELSYPGVTHGRSADVFLVRREGVQESKEHRRLALAFRKLSAR